MKRMDTKRLAHVLIGLLVLQFGLGMLANLYSKVPSVRPYVVFYHTGFIAFHALNGVLLLVLAIVFLVRALRAHANKNEAIAGLVSIVSAFTFGELFVFTQVDIYSFLMAMAFIGALINYAKVAFSSSENS